MIRILKTGFLAIPILFIAACQYSGKEKPIDVYYDVDQLVNKQIELLTKLNPEVEKTISVDGKKEQDKMKFDSLGWKNELEVFKLADINKPTLKDSYEASEEENSEGKIWRYVTEKPSLGIEYLHIYFSKDSTLRKLVARYNENNALYLSERNMEMIFDNTSGESVVSSYKIEGKQKMVMKEEVTFSIESEVVN